MSNIASKDSFGILLACVRLPPREGKQELIKVLQVHLFVLLWNGFSDLQDSFSLLDFFFNNQLPPLGSYFFFWPSYNQRNSRYPSTTFVVNLLPGRGKMWHYKGLFTEPPAGVTPYRTKMETLDVFSFSHTYRLQSNANQKSLAVKIKQENCSLDRWKVKESRSSL